MICPPLVVVDQKSLGQIGLNKLKENSELKRVEADKETNFIKN